MALNRNGSPEGSISKKIVTTKGDLITATANAIPSRLAAGSNGDTLVANSAAATGLSYEPNFAAGKNKIINGDFSIWQRGTSFSNPVTGTYTADRYRMSLSTNPTSRTVEQQTFTPGTAPVAGYEGTFFLRLTLTTVGSSTGFRVQQRIEDVRTLAGQTATLSFWAKSDSNRTNSYFVEQGFGSGGSSAVSVVASTNFSTTTSWQRFSVTFTFPSISGKTIGTGSFVLISINQELTSGAVLDLWGLQLEAGSVATAFQTATGTLQGELAACQRYFQRIVDGTNQWISTGANFSATMFETVVRFAVAMRTAPTLVIATGTNFYSISRNGGTDPINSLTLYQATTQSTLLYNDSEVSGTAGHAGNLFSNNASASIAFSSEL